LEVAVQGALCLPFGNLERPLYVDGIIVSRPEHLEYLLRHWPGMPLTAAQSARVFAALQSRVQRAAA
jgi:alpha-D-ribose 1-methylphosphonate 5-triphosphate synthase subunit PhnH